MRKKSFSILNIVVLFVNIVFLLGLLVSYLANYISPEKSTYIAVFGLFYPYLLISNAFFIIYWTLQRHRYVLISLVGILIGFTFIPRLYQLKGNKITEENENTLKIVSYNVNLFGMYNSTLYADSIFQYIEQQKPDIVCFQEYFQNKTHGYDKTIKQKIHTPYSYLFLQGKHRQLGLATFSTYPIVHSEKIQLPDTKANNATYTDIDFKGDTIRIYNIHFQSISLDVEDYLFTDQVTAAKVNLQTEDSKKSMYRILNKLKIGYKARNKQVKTIVEHIKTSPYPVVVCGDFNDPPWSYTYQQINNLLSDAFVKSGKGFGNTFFFNSRLSIRIDYIFYDNTIFDAFNFTVDKVNYSDHYPLHVVLKKRNLQTD